MNIARANARKLIKKYCLDSPVKFSLEEIANAEGLLVEEEKLKGSEGGIVFNSQNGIIVLRKNYYSEEQRRFVLAHEMGHFFNEKDSIKEINENKKYATFYYDNSIKMINSSEIEINATAFATELLMPEEQFIKITKNKRVSKNLIDDITEFFRVSLTAAALKYAEIGDEPFAVVFCKDGIIKWYRKNRYFPEDYLFNVNTKVDTRSNVNDFFKNDFCDRSENEIPIDVWCYSYKMTNYKKIKELIISIPSFNAALVLIYF